jgi:hypothetical protein
MPMQRERSISSVTVKLNRVVLVIVVLLEVVMGKEIVQEIQLISNAHLHLVEVKT